MNMQFNSNKIKGIDGLRAFAAIFILLGHIAQHDFATWVPENGDIRFFLPVCCAYVFFVISGFFAGYKPNVNDSICSYYRKKTIRIFPLYYFYVIVAVIIYIMLGKGEDVFNNTILFYALPIPNIPFCSGEGILPLVHLWFIGSLLFFYFIFPFINRCSGNHLLEVSIIIAVIWTLSKWGIYLFVGKDTFVYRFFSTLGIECLFLGVTLGVLVRKKNIIVSKIGESTAVSIISWILFLTSGLYGKYIPSACRIEYISVIACFLILSQLSINPIVDLDNKLCDWLGGISYEIYVMQIIVIILLSHLYIQWGFSLPAYLIYLIVVAVVVIIADIVHLMINKLVKNL